jgi:hypothetical protein
VSRVSLSYPVEIGLRMITREKHTYSFVHNVMFSLCWPLTLLSLLE